MLRLRSSDQRIIANIYYGRIDGLSCKGGSVTIECVARARIVRQFFMLAIGGVQVKFCKSGTLLTTDISQNLLRMENYDC